MPRKTRAKAKKKNEIFITKGQTIFAHTSDVCVCVCVLAKCKCVTLGGTHRQLVEATRTR